MIENSETMALESFDFEHLKNHFPEIHKFNFNVDTIVFEPPIDSSDVNPTHWQKLVRMIDLAYDNYDGFVILHGTDTMAYTASALSFMIQNLTKPIVLTGAQLPIGKLRTDAKENLITAIEIAADKDSIGQPIVPEVCIFFQNYLFRGNRTVKMNADNFSAFKSFNFPHLAKSGIEIRYERKEILKPNYDKRPQFHYYLDTNITILKLFPGIPQAVVEATLRATGIKAVILETFGSGNAPQLPWFIDLIRNAVRRGVIVVNVTQCAVGCVEMQRYETGGELLKAGVISGFDMTLEATLAKLMFLIGHKFEPSEIKVRMRVPLAGELTRPEDRENEKLYF
jgi:L-asparaginase